MTEAGDPGSRLLHDLIARVSAVLSDLSLIRESYDELPPDAKRGVDALAFDVNRIRRLVEHARELSYLDSGRHRVEVEPTDLFELTEALVARHGWEEAVSVSGSKAPVHTDRARIARIIAEGIDNALAHGDGQARVKITFDGSCARLEIHNRGRPIDPDDLASCFERGTRFPEDAPGAGLGLPVAKGNAELLDARLTLSSTPAGTLFSVELPARQHAP